MDLGRLETSSDDVGILNECISMSVWICERVTVGSDRARSLGWAWCLLLRHQDGADLMSTFLSGSSRAC